MTSGGDAPPWLEDSIAASNAAILANSDSLTGSVPIGPMYYNSWDSQTQRNNHINNETILPSFMSAPTTAVQPCEIPQELGSSESNKLPYSVPQTPSYHPHFVYPDPQISNAPILLYGDGYSQQPQFNSSPAVASISQYGGNSHFNPLPYGVPDFQLPRQFPEISVGNYIHNAGEGQYMVRGMAPPQHLQTRTANFLTTANTGTTATPLSLVAPPASTALAPVAGSSGPSIAGPSTPPISGPSTSRIAGPSISRNAGPSIPPIAGPSGSSIARSSIPPITGRSAPQIILPSIPPIVSPSSSPAPPAARIRNKRAASKAGSDDGSDCWYTGDNQVTPAIISSKRGDKRKRNHKVQAHRFYKTKFEQPKSWGYRWDPKAMRYSEPLFTYTEHGQLHACVLFDEQKLRFYIFNCPRKLRIWVQNCPAQVNCRLDKELDQTCRYSRCPSRRRGISAGWNRVVFDEYYEETSDGRKDPFKVAGSMHLWCFEQLADPHQLYRQEILAPDTRDFPQEEKNPMSLVRDSDKGIISGAFKPWIHRYDKKQTDNEGEKGGAGTFPRPHKESLVYQLVTYHLSHQTKARQETRAKRNATRPARERKTLDIHLGDLSVFASRTTDEIKRKRRDRLRKKGEVLEENEDPAHDYATQPEHYPSDAVQDVFQTLNQDRQNVSYVQQVPNPVQQQAPNPGQQQASNIDQKQATQYALQQPTNYIQPPMNQNAAALNQLYYTNADTGASTAPLPTSDNQLIHNSVAPEYYPQKTAPVNFSQPQLQPTPQAVAPVHQSFNPLSLLEPVAAAPVQQADVDPALFSNWDNPAPQDSKYVCDVQISGRSKTPVSLESAVDNVGAIQEVIIIEDDPESARNAVEANAGEQQQSPSSRKRPRNDVEDDAYNEQEQRPSKRAHYDAEDDLEGDSLFGSPV